MRLLRPGPVPGDETGGVNYKIPFFLRGAVEEGHQARVYGGGLLLARRGFLGKYLRERYAQHPGEFLQCGYGKILFAAFSVAQVVGVNAGQVGRFLNGQAVLLP